jgi:hypothetical protein
MELRPLRRLEPGHDGVHPAWVPVSALPMLCHWTQDCVAGAAMTDITYPAYLSWHCPKCRKYLRTFIYSEGTNLYCDYCSTRTTPRLVAARLQIQHDELFAKVKEKLEKTSYVPPPRKIRVRK